MTATSQSRSRGNAADHDILGELWDCWLHAGTRIPQRAWDTAAGLGDWTVRELYGHVSRGVRTLTDLLDRATPAAEPDLPDAAAYFRTLMALGAAGARQVATTARDWAAAHPVTTLIADFDAPTDAALRDARRAGDSAVPTIAGTLLLNDYVLTRVVEATVHLLDLGEAVAGLPTPPAAALARTVDVLVDLAPATELIRLATGRPARSVFPVLT